MEYGDGSNKDFAPEFVKLLSFNENKLGGL
jgi:hypothetical protein